MALYPLTAFRAMNAAARLAYESLRQQGTQRAIIGDLQTREQLYEILDYYSAEQQLDQRRSQS
jgi:methylisocitrate lyase